MAHILGWVILLFQPRWVFLFAFAAAIMALSSPILFQPDSDPRFGAILMFLNAAIFMAVGGPIVAIRLWLRSRKSRTDKDIDAELARIRAEAAAREGGQPPPA
ncbi:MAG: hypothetical protein R3C16_02220 [Hyphomonadaceae bacterium]